MAGYKYPSSSGSKQNLAKSNRAVSIILLNVGTFKQNNANLQQ